MASPVVLGSRLYVPKNQVEQDYLERWYYQWYEHRTEDKVDDVGDLVFNKKTKKPERVRTKESHSLRNYRIIPTVGGPYYAFPRGNPAKLKPFLKRGCYHDFRVSAPFDFKLRLKKKTLRDERWPHQRDCVITWLEKGYGTIIGGTGSGKTVIGIAVIAALGQRTILLTKRRDAYGQWVEELYKHTNIRKLEKQIGEPIVGPYKKGRPLPPITIATVQTFLQAYGPESLLEVQNEFGLLLVDEVHEVCTPQFSRAVMGVSARFVLGLTATPKRKDQRHLLLYDMMGPIIAENQAKKMDPEVTFIGTGEKVPDWLFKKPYPPHFRWLKSLNHIANCTRRTSIIAHYAMQDAREGRVVACISERRKIIRDLQTIFKREGFKVAYVDGDTKNREPIYDTVREGKVQILCAGWVLKALVNIPQLDCLHVCTPVNNETAIDQIYGRSRRFLKGKKTPLVRDYVDEEGQLAGSARNREAFCGGHKWRISHISKAEAIEALSGLWVRPSKR